MLEKRRMYELRRRIARWLKWQEEDTLPPGEFLQLQAVWERRLRTLSRRILTSRGADEEVLDNRLVETRNWLHSKNFLENVTEWKLPSVGLEKFGSSGLEFSMGFYIDDIKLEHFSRQSRVTGDVLMDVYETFTREGLDVPQGV